jgi:hypothetical protein
MDDLSSLREFRADALSSPRARAQAAERLQTLIAGQRRQRQRLIVVVAAAALLLALGGTAYGLARGYLLGDPAPDPVKAQAAMLNRVKGGTPSRANQARRLPRRIDRAGLPLGCSRRARWFVCVHAGRRNRVA